MLQKLEDFYLATLRFVVILVASLLLIAVIVLGAKSISALRPAPEPVKQTPTVSQSELKKAVLKSDTASGPTTPASGAIATDQNQAYYTRTGASIKKFFDTHFPDMYNIDPEKIASFVKERAESYPTPDLTTAYAKNLADNVDTLLSDQELIAFAKNNEPGPIIDRIFNSFSEEFDRQVKSTTAENESKQEKYLADQITAQRNLYIAASAFGIFLLIVFLSIIIRIERNLRPQSRPAA